MTAISRLDPLLEETLVATAVMAVVAGVAAALYWAVTGLSPWPYVVLAELGACGWGVAMLALTSPRRRR